MDADGDAGNGNVFRLTTLFFMSKTKGSCREREIGLFAATVLLIMAGTKILLRVYGT